MFKKLQDFFYAAYRTWLANVLTVCSMIVFIVASWDYFWVQRATRYFNNGNEYYEKGDWQSAVAEWKSASEAGKDAWKDDAFLTQSPGGFDAREDAHKAEFNLGLVYTKGGHGIVENYQEAAKWYGLAAEGGRREAQFNLGIFYLNGQGVPRNPDKGVEWLKKSARQGLQEAIDTLAELGIYDYDN